MHCEIRINPAVTMSYGTPWDCQFSGLFAKENHAKYSLANFWILWLASAEILAFIVILNWSCAVCHASKTAVNLRFLKGHETRKNDFDTEAFKV